MDISLFNKYMDLKASGCRVASIFNICLSYKQVVKNDEVA